MYSLALAEVRRARSLASELSRSSVCGSFLAEVLFCAVSFVFGNACMLCFVGERNFDDCSAFLPLFRQFWPSAFLLLCCEYFAFALTLICTALLHLYDVLNCVYNLFSY